MRDGDGGRVERGNGIVGAGGIDGVRAIARGGDNGVARAPAGGAPVAPGTVLRTVGYKIRLRASLWTARIRRGSTVEPTDTSCACNC